MSHLSGEGQSEGGRLDFDRRVRVEFHGSTISSDGGLLLYRELDDVMGLHELMGEHLIDTRTGHNRLHSIVALSRQSIFGRLAGYEDVNDADYLAVDPVMGQIVGGRAVDHHAASASQMGRFETEVLIAPENLAALPDMPGHWIYRHHAAKPLRWITLDMDSSVSPTHGTQEGTAWNGHFDCSCYHPLFVFNQFGHLERCKLRPGNVHSADGWEEVLGPVMARYADRDILRLFRADAAFALPALYATLETAGYLYAIRLPKNALLQERIADLSRRPVGRPPNEVRRVYSEFEYQAGSWDKPRRVLAKVEWHPGELLPRVGFLVTNLPFEPEQVFAFYNQRGTAEQHIKEGKIALKWTRLSCRTMAQNEVRLQLHALAYNLGMFLQAAELPDEVADEPADPAHQDRRPHRAPRPHDHLPARRGRDPARTLQPDPRRHPSPPTLAGAIMTNRLGLRARDRCDRHELHGGAVARVRRERWSERVCEPLHSQRTSRISLQQRPQGRPTLPWPL